MNANKSALSQIELRPGALATLSLNGAADALPSLSQTVTAGEGAQGRRLPLPFCVRQLTRSNLTTHWDAFCDLLKRFRVPLYCSSFDLERVPTASVPQRYAVHYANEPLSAPELQTAEAFEVRCALRSALPPGRWQWGWSEEIDRERLVAFIDALRTANLDETPLGIGLPLSADRQDINVAVQADIDFLALNATSPALTVIDLTRLVQVREQVRDAGRSELTILVDAPLHEPGDVLKLLCLGASVVAIDSLLQHHIPAAKPTASTAGTTGGGLLGGIALPKVAAEPKLVEMQRAMDELTEALRVGMRQVGSQRLGELSREMLVTTSESLSRLTGISLFGSK